MRLAFKHEVISTPIDTFNILNCGGLKEQSITEIYGKERAGKSSLAYEIGANFQRKYPKTGQVVVIDAENSMPGGASYMRFLNTFGYDLDRLSIEPTDTLEEGFATLTDICQGRFNYGSEKAGWPISKAKAAVAGIRKLTELLKLAGLESHPWIKTKTDEDREKAVEALIKTGHVVDGKGANIPPTFVVWDTIVASAPKAEFEPIVTGKDDKGAGGGAFARALTPHLRALNTQIREAPVTVVFLNQIRIKNMMSPYVTDRNSPGGFAFKHFAHYRMWINYKAKEIHSKSGLNIGTKSVVSVEKSKFSPTFNDIPIYIDDTLGGKIVPRDEIQEVAKILGVLVGEGRKFYFSGDHSRIYSAKEILNSSEVRARCLDEVARVFRRSYSTVDALYRELGVELGKLSDEEIERYREEISSGEDSVITVDAESSHDILVDEDDLA